MKRLLIAILLISSLLITNTFAEKEKCFDVFDAEYKAVDQFKNETKYRDEVKFFKYIVKSRSDKPITYTANFKTDSDKIFSEIEIVVPPFGVATGYMDLRGKNMDMIWNKEATPYMSCKFGSASLKNKKNTNNMNVAAPRAENFKTWHIIAAIGVFFILAVLYDAFFGKNKPSQKRKIKRKETSDFDKRYKEGSNFIETVWNGQETMAKIFWIYCLLTVAILSFIAGILSQSQGPFIFIIPAITIIWSNTGLWRSSNVYQNLKLQSNQTYGWATAAKIYVVLNYVTTLSQFGFILRGV